MNLIKIFETRFKKNLNCSFFLTRYLTWQKIFLTNLERTHPGAKELLSKGAIVVAGSMIPGALCAVDNKMEEPFMLFAKSSGKEFIVYVHSAILIMISSLL